MPQLPIPWPVLVPLHPIALYPQCQLVKHKMRNIHKFSNIYSKTKESPVLLRISLTVHFFILYITLHLCTTPYTFHIYMYLICSNTKKYLCLNIFCRKFLIFYIHICQHTFHLFFNLIIYFTFSTSRNILCKL